MSGNHSLRTPAAIEEKIVHLRLTYHFGPTRIAWYLGRYHGFSISTHGVYNVLVRSGINRDVVRHFSFRIHTVRTLNGHEFQTKFHWHVEDQGMRHVYIMPASPNLNGKVERSHLTDKLEFYQLLTYTDDVDRAEKLAAWEEFYNVHRPHRGLGGLTPYEVLKDKMAL